ncbi:MAG: N-acetylmuramoyl-L-alanine amidase [Neobacillus sp.]|jgi:hypothetical protein|nr:N-acetylmuramoyl-L-alanine amidase [Neobacillus sp.]
MYEITRDYISKGNARSGQLLVGGKPQFGVAHDIGNGASTAYNNRTYFNREQPSASAHTFIDDKYILEIIPVTVGVPEKAWHVIYDVTTDNIMFGDDANDIAIGVELCWGGNIVWAEAYKRYVWYWAYLCRMFSWDPRKKIVPHSQLDPKRKTDPDKNAFVKNCITWDQFISDVVNAMIDSYWQKTDGKWYFYKNGVKQTGWVLDNNKWYYLDAAGVMVIGWQKDKGKWYLLGTDGAMLTGWQHVNDKWYYMHPSGATAFGWLFWGGKWYYLNPKNESGAMLKDTVVEDNGKKYYLNSKGEMATNTEVKVTAKATNDGSLVL